MIRQYRRLLCIYGLLLSQVEAFYVAPLTRIPPAPGTSVSSASSSLTRLSMVLESSTTPTPTSNTMSPAQVEKTIVKLGRRGLTDEALEVYHSIAHPTVRHWNSALDASARARPARLDEALQLFEHGISKHSLKPNVFTFGAIVSACSRAQRADKAIQVLRSMEVSCIVLSVCDYVMQTVLLTTLLLLSFSF